MATQTDEFTGSSTGEETTRSTDLYRCIQDRLGSSPRQSADSREMASADVRSYKCVGTQSSFSGSFPLEKQTGQQKCQHCNGQLYCSCLHQLDGWNQITVDDAVDQTSIPPDILHPSRIVSQAHSRETQHTSGCPVQTRQDHLNRMVPSPSGVEVDSTEVEDSADRLVCDIAQQPSASLCQSSSGSSGVCSRCSYDGLIGIDSLCISSDGANSSSSSQMQNPQNDPLPGSPRLADQSMVSGLAVSANRSASQTSNLDDSAQATKIRQISQESCSAESSRLETIKCNMETAGFSTQVSEAVSQSIRPSTSSLYDFQWKRFQRWRIREQLEDQTVTNPMVADFLCHLRIEQSLRHNILEGYRSTLASVLDKQGLNVGSDPILHDLLRSFELKYIPTPRIKMKWDLSVVLSGLTRRPFEPLHQASLSHLAWKTTFVMALATASRVSELHAIDWRTISFPKDPHRVTFKLLPEFLAKNQRASLGPLGQRVLSSTSFTTYPREDFF